MPIPVTCPECDTKFKADDSRAGKKDTCPECGERVPVPEAAAKPATARPVVAARPATAKPVAVKPQDEEDDHPKSKRRRDDAEDEDDAPKSKRRKGGEVDDGEDDAPKKRRRRDADDDDDKPKKKGGKALVIVGVVLGVLLIVCGGGSAAVYFLVVAPIAKKAKEFNDSIQSDLDNALKDSSAGKLTPPNTAKIQKGWTLAQCQEVLGKGSKADGSDIFTTLSNLPPAAPARPGWAAKAKSGQVYRWTDFPDSVAVAFDADPTVGKVVAVVANVGGKGSEPITLGGVAPPPAVESGVTLAADDLTDRVKELTDQLATVGGRVRFSNSGPDGSGSVELEAGPDKKWVRLGFRTANWTRDKIKSGDTVQAKGKVLGVSGNQFIDVTECVLVQHTPAKPATDPPAALTADQLAQDALKHNGKVVTVNGTIAKVNPQGVGGGNVELVAAPGKRAVRVSFDAPNWKSATFKAGDLLGAKGTVTNGAEFVEVVQSEVILIQAGKGPPQPPKVDPPKVDPPKPPADDAMAVKADDFVAEYIKDAAAADAKYKDKLVRLTGEVKSTTPLSVLFADKADGGFTYHVTVLIPQDGRAAIADLKVGEKATVVAKVGTMSTRITTKTKSIRLIDGKIEK